MGVGDEEQAIRSSKNNNGVLGFKWERGGGSRPINRTFSTSSGQKPVLKGHSLAPVCVTNRCQRLCLGPWHWPVLKGSLTPGRKKIEVFGYFGHRPMPHSVVVSLLHHSTILSIYHSSAPCTTVMRRLR